jgi:hypothetical protein
VHRRALRTQRGELLRVVVGEMPRVDPADAVEELLRPGERGLHRYLLIEQCTYENSEGILVQQGIGRRITG